MVMVTILVVMMTAMSINNEVALGNNSNEVNS